MYIVFNNSFARVAFTRAFYEASCCVRGKKKYFFKWANPDLFFIYFRSFQSNNTSLTTNQCEKMSCQSNIIVPGFEPATFKFESHPITTRPELPPKKKKCLVSNTKSYLAFLHSSQAFLWNKNAISID